MLRTGADGARGGAETAMRISTRGSSGAFARGSAMPAPARAPSETGFAPQPHGQTAETDVAAPFGAHHPSGPTARVAGTATAGACVVSTGGVHGRAAPAR